MFGSLVLLQFFCWLLLVVRVLFMKSLVVSEVIIVFVLGLISMGVVQLSLVGGVFLVKE